MAFKYDYSTGKYRFIAPRGDPDPDNDLTKDIVPPTPHPAVEGILNSSGGKPLADKIKELENALGYRLTTTQIEKLGSVLLAEPKPDAYERYQNYRGSLYKAFPPGIMVGDEYVRQPQPTLQQIQDVRKYSGLNPLELPEEPKVPADIDQIEYAYRNGLIDKERYELLINRVLMKGAGMLPSAGKDLRMSEYESGSLGLDREREAREGREFESREGRLGEEFDITESRLGEELDWKKEVAESNRLLEEAKFAHQQAQDDALLAIQEAQLTTDREYKQALIANAQAQLAETKRQFEIAEARARRAQVLAEQQAKQQAISQWTQLYGYGPNWSVRGAPGAGGITSEDVAKMASSATGWR